MILLSRCLNDESATISDGTDARVEQITTTVTGTVAVTAKTLSSMTYRKS
jgi:hypothetical protein